MKDDDIHETMHNAQGKSEIKLQIPCSLILIKKNPCVVCVKEEWKKEKCFNSLPNYKFLEWSKMKAVADDKITD